MFEDWSKMIDSLHRKGHISSIILNQTSYKNILLYVVQSSK